MMFHDFTQGREARPKFHSAFPGCRTDRRQRVLTDTQGVIQYVNPAFEATTGYSRDEALGKTPRILKSGLHDAEFYRQMWAQFAQGLPFKGMVINRKKTGELYWAQQTITSMRDEAGHLTHFVSVSQDITELRKKQEQEFQLQLARDVQQRFYADAPVICRLRHCRLRPPRRRNRRRLFRLHPHGRRLALDRRGRCQRTWLQLRAGHGPHPRLCALLRCPAVGTR